MRSIERRLDALYARWSAFVLDSDQREASQLLRAGADPAKDWQQWPAELLSLLSSMGEDPAEVQVALRAVVDRAADGVIRIVWLDRMPAAWEEQPLVAVQPGYLDLLRPDPEPRVTTLPMNPESRKRFGDDPPTLVVSYTDKPAHNAHTPAIGASMPELAPERPQTPPQAPEPPYNFEEARRSTLALARRQDRTKRRLHVR